ncbi:MAG: iron-containing alcohol dehydrogenase [Candidatus Thorarchaeota archaeon]
MQFELLSLPQIIFGVHRLNDMSNILPDYGTKFLLVGSTSAIQAARENCSFFDDVIDKGMVLETQIVKGEPTVQFIDDCVTKVRELGTDGVIAMGGGSAIDTGKAVAGISTNGGSARDYMEVIGKGSKVEKSPLPFIAIPTTAGTGSEVTKNAVIHARDEELKASIRSPLLIPKLAVLDPIILTSVPPSVTASCGMDAFTQLVEAFTSKHAHPLTDTLALAGIEKVRKSLVRSYTDGKDLQARSDMLYASLLSGICLANAGLGAVHGFASPMGGFDIPHGMICASLLGPVIETNLQEITRSSIPNSNTLLTKYLLLAKALLPEFSASEADLLMGLVSFIKDMGRDLNIPTLSQLGIDTSDFPSLVEKAKRTSSMRYNPIELDQKALFRILETAY